MEQLRKDLRKFRVINEIQEDIVKNITKSISASDEIITLHIGTTGDLITNAAGFLGFINVINPAFIKSYKVANLNLFKFYYDAYYIVTILDDSEAQDFKNAFDKLYQKAK